MWRERMSGCGRKLVPFDQAAGFNFDHLSVWLKHLGFWTPKIEAAIIKAGYHLPLELEIKFLEKYHLPIKDEHTLEILKLISASNTGINVLDISKKDKNRTDYLAKVLLLIREDTSKSVFKPLAPASNSGVQYLVGLIPADKIN